MIGETVGNYRITELLGEGGMGTVYLASHPTIGRRAAVKILHPHLARDREMVTRFLNEARAANAIRHPGIVEIFDSGTHVSGASYIVMELLEGESLRTRLARGRLPLPEILEIGRQAASALGAAHAAGIVHRDLKPDHLFLTADPRHPGRCLIKILDFGIAKLSQSDLGSGSVKTRTGAVMGTPTYMSPEQCRGTREVDRRSDIYSLGVILFEMVCGRPPFVSDGLGQLVHMHLNEPAPSPSLLAARIPESLERALLKALEKDPAARFQSMAALEQAIGGPSSAVPRPAGPDPSAGFGQPGRGGEPETTLGSSVVAFARTLREEDLRPRAVPRRGVAIIAGTAIAVALAAVLTSRLGLWQPAATLALRPKAPAVAAPLTKTIEVSIDTSPPGARVVRERDGKAIGVTPFREAWPFGAGGEKLRLERTGHLPERVVVSLDRGITAYVELTRSPPPARAGTRPKRN